MTTHEDYADIQLKKLYSLQERTHSMKVLRRVARLIKFFEEYKSGENP